jgi:hypothetical protein
MILLLFTLAVGAQAPDSVRQARFERVLKQASDSLDGVRGAAAVFRTDLPSASSELVLSRAARVHTGCRGADAALLQVDTLLAGGVYSRRAMSEQAQLQNATAELRRVLGRCQREWAVPQFPSTATADSLRAWGPYRTAQLDSALRRYLYSLRGFMKKAMLRKPAVS